MSNLYVTATTDAIKTNRTARGNRSVSAALQSYEGSVSHELRYSENGDHYISVKRAQESTAHPSIPVFHGTVAEYFAKLRA